MNRMQLPTGLILSLALVVMLIGCGQNVDENLTTNVNGIDRANFDTTCQPCKDFYQYANGTWLAKNPIPGEYSSWSVTHEVYERNNTILREILDETSKKSAAKGSAAQKIGDFYFSGMDTAAIEAAGFTPIAADLEKIEAISSRDELVSLITEYHTEGVGFLFAMDAYEDLTNSERIILYVEQGGLGMPDRDYYSREGEEAETLRTQYVQHVANMLMLIGDDSTTAAAGANAVMTLETSIAAASLTRVELRDFNTWYNVMAIDDANKITSNISWTKYVAAIGVPEVEELSLGPEKFFTEINKQLAETSLDDWKSYLRWHMVSRASTYLSSEFVQEDFNFYSATLRGTKELRPRWKRALRWISGFMGEALGQLYVERAFPPDSKVRALAMVEDLRSAVRNRINELEWMSDETKVKALTKLEAFTPKIGYPDKWRDYSALEIDRGHLIDNARRGRAFEKRRTLNKIGQPIDKTEWAMAPQTVNAYYNPVQNEIVFPAGILQPPFFDGSIDDAVNYGAMGGVIGHEMLHGFDDKGSQFDADGNMKNWWTDDDRAKFEAKTERLIAQFDAFVAVDSLHVNGSLTIGENIGDLGGLRVALAALDLAREGKADPMVDDMTQHQRFFHSWAQAWRNNATPETQKLQVNTDPHSPARFRVLGPFVNIAEFHEAFGCKEGDDMYRAPEDQIRIW